jgi:hypothetical protein
LSRLYFTSLLSAKEAEMRGPNNGSRKERLVAEAQFFQSPWSETTEKVRNQILVVSLAGILMAAAGIFPREITALGLKLGYINQKALLVIWAIVDAYLTFTLALHAYSDFMHGYWSELNKIEVLDLPTDENVRDLVLEQMKLRARLKNVHLLRLLIDLLIPLLSGIIAFSWLLWRCFRI